jgi:hypothetical protein
MSSTSIAFGSAAALLAASVLIPGLSACQGQVIDCSSASGGFGAKYLLQGAPTGTCSEALTKELTELGGDIIGLQWYVQDHYNRKPGVDRNTLAVQTNTMGSQARTYATRKTTDGAAAVDKSAVL